MKKTLRIVGLGLAAVLLSVGMTACLGGDDDEDGEDLWEGSVEAPAYESDASCYTILDSDELESIELTASGNYIIVPTANGSYYNAPLKNSKAEARRGRRMFSRQSQSRASDGMDIIFGEYSKLGDGSYNLDGYGKLTVVDDNTLIVTPNGGTEMTLRAEKKGTAKDSDLNNRFCRTWYVESVKRQTYSGNNLIDEYNLPSSEIHAEYVKYVVVSKAGTFLQTDWDDSVESYGTWRWQNTKNQVFRYDFIDEEGEGEVQVSFSGNKATFIEKYIEYDDDYDRDLLYVERITTRSK